MHASLGIAIGGPLFHARISITIDPVERIDEVADHLISMTPLRSSAFLKGRYTSMVVSLDEFNELIDRVVGLISSVAKFEPDTILALSTGGFPVAAALAKQLSIISRNVVGLPVYKDATGDYHLDDRILKLQNCAGLTFLVVDDASNRGLLTQKAVQAVEAHGGKAKSCVLVAWKGGVQPDFVGRTCASKPPKFFWEGPAISRREAG